MPKTKKKMMSVLTVRSTCHIPVDPTDLASVARATSHVNAMRSYASNCGQTTVVARMNRIPVNPTPAPEAAETDDRDMAPPDDGLDIPARLDRRAETEPAAAE